VQWGYLEVQHSSLSYWPSLLLVPTNKVCIARIYLGCQTQRLDNQDLYSTLHNGPRQRSRKLLKDRTKEMCRNGKAIIHRPWEDLLVKALEVVDVLSFSTTSSPISGVLARIFCRRRIGRRPRQLRRSTSQSCPLQRRTNSRCHGCLQATGPSYVPCTVDLSTGLRRGCYQKPDRRNRVLGSWTSFQRHSNQLSTELLPACPAPRSRTPTRIHGSLEPSSQPAQALDPALLVLLTFTRIIPPQTHHEVEA